MLATSMSAQDVHALVVACLARVVLVASLAGGMSAGCTRAELEHKADAYNAAIAESTNEAILLNAVRASQRAPMSFTGLGSVNASPTFSGAASGTFNFDPFGLTSYSLNPSVKAEGGFSSYTMSNLNTDKFMKRIRDPVPTELVRYFQKLKWPEELLELMIVASYDVSREDLARIERSSEAMCSTRSDPRTTFICSLIYEAEAARRAAGCHQFEEGGGIITILNTGRDLCGMTKFQIFLRRMRLLHIPAFGRFGFVPRSAQGMLYYLGELTAAQNYSVKPYIPTTYVTTPEGRRSVALFVVRRGAAPPGEAAVRVYYSGEQFYIPRPELGTVDEARSLQVLDFVSQVISAQTTADDVPKVSTIVVPVAR